MAQTLSDGRWTVVSKRWGQLASLESRDIVWENLATCTFANRPTWKDPFDQWKDLKNSDLSISTSLEASDPDCKPSCKIEKTRSQPQVSPLSSNISTILPPITIEASRRSWRVECCFSCRSRKNTCSCPWYPQSILPFPQKCQIELSSTVVCTTCY